MRTDKADIYYAETIFHHNNHSIIISFYVEYNAIIRQETCIAINTLDVRWLFPIRMFYVRIPCLQRLATIGVIFPKFSQGFAGYNSHVASISYVPTLGAPSFSGRKRVLLREQVGCIYLYAFSPLPFPLSILFLPPSRGRDSRSDPRR